MRTSAGGATPGGSALAVRARDRRSGDGRPPPAGARGAPAATGGLASPRSATRPGAPRPELPLEPPPRREQSLRRGPACRPARPGPGRLRARRSPERGRFEGRLARFAYRTPPGRLHRGVATTVQPMMTTPPAKMARLREDSPLD